MGGTEMSQVFFISDLHLGHRNILKYSPNRFPGVTTVDEHDQALMDTWNQTVNRKDLVWVLGDVAMTREGLDKVAGLNGRKKLVLGNHDEFSMYEYLDYFDHVCGLAKEYGAWLSHAPIHPDELRGKKNIHGHLHSKTIPDERYINVSVEQCGGVPVPLDFVKQHLGV